MIELWKDIPGYEDSYQISNYGRVINKQTKQLKKIHLESAKGRTGRARCQLSCHNKPVNICIAQYVMKLFGAQYFEGKPISYRDSDPNNCRIDNLYYENKNTPTGLRNKVIAYLDDSAELVSISRGGKNSNWQALITVKCKKCGRQVTRTATSLYSSKGFCCYACKSKDVLSRKIQYRNIVEQNKLIRAQKAKDNSENRKAMQIHYCRTCGQAFMMGSSSYRLYCSNKCKQQAVKDKKKRQNKLHDKRLNRCGIRDNSITLKELYERDEGICWLCGELCDWTDIKRSKKTMVAGDAYPSIDHVIPIAKGGQHTWDNVRLAHRKCNYEKRDKILQINDKKDAI